MIFQCLFYVGEKFWYRLKSRVPQGRLSNIHGDLLNWPKRIGSQIHCSHLLIPIVVELSATLGAYAYSHGNTVEDNGFVNHLFSKTLMPKDARFELSRIQVTTKLFFSENQVEPLRWVCKYLVFFGLVTQPYSILNLNWRYASAYLMCDKTFGVGWRLEIIKKEFQRYIWICWIDPKDLEDKYIILIHFFLPINLAGSEAPGR